MYKQIGSAESHSQLDRAWKENAWKISNEESWSRNVGMNTDENGHKVSTIFQVHKKAFTAEDGLNN